jgi:AcrR family transcriptional regulator
MSVARKAPSARENELLEGAYRYVLAHGLADLSLRPLAESIGSSPRVLLFLFGSKDGLVRALLARARSDELAMLERLSRDHPDADLVGALSELWGWLSDPSHQQLLRLWAECYARSLVEPTGPWGGFARATVTDWLDVLARYQPPRFRHTASALAQRTAALALLRGALLDLLATGDGRRITPALQSQIKRFRIDERRQHS